MGIVFLIWDSIILILFELIVLFDLNLSSQNF